MFTLKQDIALRLTPENGSSAEAKLFARWVDRLLREVPAHERQGRRGLELLVIYGSESMTFVIYDDKLYWSPLLTWDNPECFEHGSSTMCDVVYHDDGPEGDIYLREFALRWLKEALDLDTSESWIGYPEIPGLF